MHWLFLVPFTTGVVSGYFCQKSQDDIAYMMATISVISLFIGLVIAPWQVQIGILGLTLLIAGKFWQKRSKSQDLPVTEDHEKKYLYRGVPYSQESPSHPSLPVAVSEESVGKYRGVEVHLGQQKTPQAPATTPRKYRGVTIEPGA